MGLSLFLFLSLIVPLTNGFQGKGMRFTSTAIADSKSSLGEVKSGRNLELDVEGGQIACKIFDPIIY